MKSKIILTCLCLFLFAADKIRLRQSPTEKKNFYLDHGVFVGGFSQPNQSLKSVRFGIDKGIERIVLDLGLEKSEGLARPGFFHAALQTDPQRILLDLQDVKSLEVTEAQVKKAVAKSTHIKDVTFFFDKAMNDLTIEFSLRHPVEFEVFELTNPGKPGRLVMDLKGQ